MYPISSLCSMNRIISRRSLLLLSQKRFVVLRPVPKPLFQELNSSESFEAKNARLKRPLSPHLTIYKPQITSMLSITHRVTGCAFYVVLLAFSTAGYDLYSVENLVLFLQSLQLSPVTWFTIKAAIISPFSFHAANGVRHLLWDFGFFLTNKAVTTTGYAAIAAAVAFTAYVASL